MEEPNPDSVKNRWLLRAAIASWGTHVAQSNLTAVLTDSGSTQSESICRRQYYSACIVLSDAIFEIDQFYAQLDRPDRPESVRDHTQLREITTPTMRGCYLTYPKLHESVKTFPHDSSRKS